MNNKPNKIEDAINDIIEYLSSCSRVKFSNNMKIAVERDKILDDLEELKKKIPDEVNQLKQILKNKENILNKAKVQAEEIISQAKVERSEQLSDNQILQAAYADANEVILNAQDQADRIRAEAQQEADAIYQEAEEQARILQERAVEYTDGLLQGIQDLLWNAMETTQARTENLLVSLNDSYEAVISNREQLIPEMEGGQYPEGEEMDGDGQDAGNEPQA